MGWFPERARPRRRVSGASGWRQASWRGPKVGAGSRVFGSGAFGHDPAADPREPNGSVSETVLASVVLRQQGVAALVRADTALTELAGRPYTAAEPVSFECVSHGMASSVLVLRWVQRLWSTVCSRSETWRVRGWD